MFYITNVNVVFQGYISTGAVYPLFVRCPCSTRKPLVRLSSYTAFAVVRKYFFVSICVEDD